jgi:hypothetical protein
MRVRGAVGLRRSLPRRNPERQRHGNRDYGAGDYKRNRDHASHSPKPADPTAPLTLPSRPAACTRSSCAPRRHRCNLRTLGTFPVSTRSTPRAASGAAAFLRPPDLASPRSNLVYSASPGPQHAPLGAVTRLYFGVGLLHPFHAGGGSALLDFRPQRVAVNSPSRIRRGSIPSADLAYS